MPQAYHSVSKKSTPWSKTEKIIKDKGQGGISLRALSEELDMGRDSREFTVTLEALDKRNSCEYFMGVCSKYGSTCLMLVHKDHRKDEHSGREEATRKDDEDAHS